MLQVSHALCTSLDMSKFITQSYVVGWRCAHKIPISFKVQREFFTVLLVWWLNGKQGVEEEASLRCPPALVIRMTFNNWLNWTNFQTIPAKMHGPGDTKHVPSSVPRSPAPPLNVVRSRQIKSRFHSKFSVNFSPFCSSDGLMVSKE